MRIRSSCQYILSFVFVVGINSGSVSGHLIIDNHMSERKHNSAQAENKAIKNTGLRTVDSELNPYNCSFFDMLSFYLKKLDLEGDEIHIYSMNSKNNALLGLTKEVENGYEVLLQEALSSVELRVTLAHELVHVKQLKEGRVNAEHFKQHYLDRPLEQEAFEKGLYLAMEFYTEKRCLAETALSL